jgi:hypothetical protein
VYPDVSLTVILPAGYGIDEWGMPEWGMKSEHQRLLAFHSPFPIPAFSIVSSLAAELTRGIQYE